MKTLQLIDGKVETAYVDLEMKKLLDTRNKKYRIFKLPIPTEHRKKSLQQRQKVARDLRMIRKRIKAINTNDF